MISASVKWSGDEIRGIVKDVLRETGDGVRHESPKDSASRALAGELARQSEAQARADRKKTA